jgi:SulP family sulfate permease
MPAAEPPPPAAAPGEPRPRWPPSTAWLPALSPADIRADAVAGVTLAAYLIPAGIGDASLAGLPAQAGLYACLAGGMLFWIFCSSRRTTVSVTSAISLLLGSSLAQLSGGDTSRFPALASATALLVAAITLTAWIIRAGVIVNFISETVLIGFKCGVALFLASSQLPKLFGFHGPHEGGFWHRALHFFNHAGETNPASLALGAGALGVLILGKVFFKHRPVAIAVVVAGIAAAGAFDLAAHGVALLGEVPQGPPRIALPAVTLADLDQLLPLAFACVMLGSVETVAIGRMFAARSGVRFDPNKEFLALAAANLGAGLASGYPVSGGMSQSLVNDSAGARTPLSGLFASLLILVVILFFSHLLKSLPQPVLAAIVLMAVAGLFRVDALRYLWKTDRAEFVIALAALLGVLGSGLLRGVFIGAGLSMLRLIYLASRPNVAVLGRIPGSRRYSDLARHPDNESIPGLLIVRPEGALVYFNAEHVLRTVERALRTASPHPTLVLCDLSASPRLDYAACEMLRTMANEFTRAGARLHLVETHAEVRDMLRLHHVDTVVGGVNRFKTVADAADEFLSGAAPGPG